jgi:hypothetical protein
MVLREFAATQPGLEAGEHEVNDGQKGFRDVHVAALRDGGMKVSTFPERCIAAPVVSNNGSARCHGAFYEAGQRLGAPVKRYGEAGTQGIPAGLSFAEAADTFALQNFSIKHIDNHERSRLVQMLNILHLVGLGANRISTVPSSGIPPFPIFLTRE